MIPLWIRIIDKILINLSIFLTFTFSVIYSIICVRPYWVCTEESGWRTKLRR